MTPLHWATEQRHRRAVELLLRYGAYVEATSKFDKTPLEIASDKNHTEIYEMLQVYLFSPSIRKSFEYIYRC